MRRSACHSQHAQSLNNMPGEIPRRCRGGGGGWGRDEDSTAIGGKKAATASVASATSCVPNDWLYSRLYTDLSLGMAHASPQATLSSFDIRKIGNAISVYIVGSPKHVEELDCRFEVERRG